tara:strand:+ start:2521 stop:2988 length:468 start_codon:yes stop_codon:yes gene_type:complete
VAKGLQPWKSKQPSTVLKKFFENLIKRYGHSVLYRRYDVGTKSSYYSDATGQGEGGPAWIYSDESMKIRHDPMSIRGAVGLTVQKSKMYLPASAKPKRGDVVIELSLNEDDPTDYQIFNAQHREAFEIDEIDVKRGLRGRIIYYLVSVTPHMGYY